jgi:CRP/FNR family cyclic AMP-dependent transcriptional regulator
VFGRRSPDGPAELWPAGTLMARLDQDARQALLGLRPAQSCEPGIVLIRQGDLDHTDVYLIRSTRLSTPACAKVTASLDNGSETVLGIRLSGDIVGELAVLRHAPRSATVATCTRALIHKIPADVFMGFLSRHPHAWEAVSRMIADQLDWANRRRLDIAGRSVPARLARVLVELVDLHGYPTPEGHDIGVSLSQAELGRLICAGEDAVGKAMRTLRNAGLARGHYRRVTILDLAGLRAYEPPPAE